jgi:hypothetical protein
LVNELIKNNANQSSLNILIQDLPMLIEFQKVDLSEFLNISIIEDSSFYQINSIDSNKGKKFFCNIEQIIESSDL